MACGGDAALPLVESKDLVRLANHISPNSTFQIGITYLGLSKIEVEFCRANAHSEGGDVAHMYNFNILERWRRKSGPQGTKKALHDLLVKASETGIMDSDDLGFLHTEAPPPRTPTTPKYGNFNKEPVPLPVQHQRSVSEQLQGSAAAVDLPVRSHSEKTVSCTKYQNIDTTRYLYQDANLSLNHSLTIGTELLNWENTKFCRLCCGDTVVYGRKVGDPDTRRPGFYVYSSGGIKKIRLEDFCKHEDSKKDGFIAVTISSMEFVAIVCPQCQSIQLLDIDGKRFLEAYQNTNVSCGPLCQSEPNTMYLVARRLAQDTQSIYILDTGSKIFSERKVLNTEITGNVSTIVHAAGKDSLILYESETNKVIAASDKTGHTFWQLQGVINGASYIPKTVCHYFTHQTNGVGGAIIVGDGSSKVMVFSTVDGKYKHEISDGHLKSVAEIDCVGDMLIVQQENNGSIEFLFYHIKCEFESPV